MPGPLARTTNDTGLIPDVGDFSGGQVLELVPGEQFLHGDFCTLIFYDVVPGEQFLHGDF